MKHILGILEYNQRHMEFITSNSSAGAQGKELRPAGPTPPKMSQEDYLRNMSNAFNDQAISFRKIKKRKASKQTSRLFKSKKRK